MQHLLDDIRGIIAQARERAARSVNHELTLLYWQIGRVIVEDEQHGADRAGYKEYLLKNLSEQLVKEFGEGYSRRQLELFRQLYLNFPIVNTLYSQLTWSHYKLLVRLDAPEKREFYIAESVKNAWSVRQMERQINSLLYERLLMSQEKESVLGIARGERSPTRPHEIIKDPTVLEFFGLKPEASYYEIDLEGAIITHLQDFLLEMGNGFSFVARQKRIILGGDEFKIDLVFYN
jgi:predicted nuclease of restriction endonuclease-like (RecB) superfamily